MKIIKELEELIEEELHDIKKYAQLAVEMKNDHPGLAQVFYNLSTQEDAQYRSEADLVSQIFTAAHR